MLLVLLLGYAFLFCALSNMSTAKPLYRTVLSRFFRSIGPSLWRWLRESAGPGWSSDWKTRAASPALVSRLSLAGACLVFLAGRGR